MLLSPRRTLALRILTFCGLAVAPALADPVTVTISGNFGAPQGGSSVFDNQNYTVDFLIPDSALPSSTTCCSAQIAATYDVNAQLVVPGLGLVLDDALQVQYITEAPSGQWLNILNFVGLPQGDFLLLTPFQISSGDLWNGLAGPLGTPDINLLNNVPGTGIWRLEQPSPAGALPIAVYPNGAATISAATVPEPGGGWLLGTALVALGLFRQKWTGNCPR